MSEKLNKYLKKLNKQELLNDNIREPLRNHKIKDNFYDLNEEEKIKLENATPDFLNENSNLENNLNLNLDPEIQNLLSSINSNIDPMLIRNLNITAEELVVIINLKNEVDAALGLVPENVNLNDSNNYAGISEENYALITGRSLIEDIGTVDPQNKINPEVAKGIYNRDTALLEIREDLSKEDNSKTQKNKYEKPSYRYPPPSPYNT